MRLRLRVFLLVVLPFSFSLLGVRSIFERNSVSQHKRQDRCHWDRRRLACTRARSASKSLYAALQKLQQRAYGLMQAITTKTDQVVKVCDDAPIDHLTLFECTDDFRTNVRAATNSRSVSEHFRSLFDGSNDPLVSCHLV